MRTIIIAYGAFAPILAFVSPKDAEQYVESASRGCGFAALKTIEVPIVDDMELSTIIGPCGSFPLDQASEVEL